MNRIPKKKAAKKPMVKTPPVKPAWAAIADQMTAAPGKKPC